MIIKKNMYKDEEFYRIFQSKGIFIFDELLSINKNQYHNGWGSYLFDGIQYKYDITMYEKQKLLYNLAKQSSKILEIGVYMGHSILIMLLANPRINITAIDISGNYAEPSIKFLQKKFPHAKINLIINDSVKALKLIKDKYDLFHIDGLHHFKTITNEFNYVINLANDNNNFRVLFDDIEAMSQVYKNIKKNFDCSITSPHCSNPNCLVEIKLDKKNIKEQLKKFKKDNFKIYIRHILIIDIYKILFISTRLNKILFSYFEKYQFFSSFKKKLKKTISKNIK